MLCYVGAEPCKPYKKRIRSIEQKLNCKTRILNHFDSIFATTCISSSIGIIHAMAIGFGIISIQYLQPLASHPTVRFRLIVDWYHSCHGNRLWYPCDKICSEQYAVWTRCTQLCKIVYQSGNSGWLLVHHTCPHGAQPCRGKHGPVRSGA